MPIKDKDGNLYRLRGPNPVMKKQDRWDESKLVFHNMEFGSVVIADESRSSTLTLDEPIGKVFVVPDHGEFDLPPFEDALNEPDSESPIIEPKPIQVEDQIAKLLADKKIVFHCLPVTTHRFEDSFYSETNKRVTFGKKFDFPGIVVKWDDLHLRFWTDREIPDQSVVFPTKLEMKRWWRVQKSKPKSGGYMVESVPSDISPDFS